MLSASATFIFLLGLSVGLVSAAWLLILRLTPEHRKSGILRWLSWWTLKGMVLPLMVWAVMNFGLSWYLQPFMPQVQAAQNRGEWAPEFFHVLAVGMFILSTYWLAMTLGWVLFSASRTMDPEPRKDFRSLFLTCLLGLSIPALILLLLGGWTMLGVAGALLLVPMAAYAPGLLNPPRLPPLYARAIARMKFGKYNEAESEILRELEKCEDDFDGWMMLAELYATQFHDLPEAERTVREICDQPRITPPQLSIALHRLADWHLKIGGDPAGSRRALETICERLSGTHLGHMARLRLNQLPVSKDDWREQQAVKPIPLPALGDQLDEAPAPIEPQAKAASVRAANECVEKLKQDPNNVMARDKLARIFTEQLNRPDLGIEQVELLLAVPKQPDSRRAEWLGLVAAWNLRYRGDDTAARLWLTRLLREYPQTPQAFAARRRLQLLETASKERLAGNGP